MNINMIPDYN